MVVERILPWRPRIERKIQYVAKTFIIAANAVASTALRPTGDLLEPLRNEQPGKRATAAPEMQKNRKRGALGGIESGRKAAPHACAMRKLVRSVCLLVPACLHSRDGRVSAYPLESSHAHSFFEKKRPCSYEFRLKSRTSRMLCIQKPFQTHHAVASTHVELQ